MGIDVSQQPLSTQSSIIAKPVTDTLTLQSNQTTAFTIAYNSVVAGVQIKQQIWLPGSGISHDSCFPTGRKRPSNGNKCDLAAAASAASAAEAASGVAVSNSGIYMTYDRNAKRADNCHAVT